MNNKNLDALFTGLTGTQISPTSEQPANQEPNVRVKNLDTERELSEEVTEERFCTIVQSDILRKIRIIAKREGLQIRKLSMLLLERPSKATSGKMVR